HIVSPSYASASSTGKLRGRAWLRRLRRCGPKIPALDARPRRSLRLQHDLDRGRDLAEQPTAVPGQVGQHVQDPFLRRAIGIQIHPRLPELLDLNLLLLLRELNDFGLDVADLPGACFPGAVDR